MKKIFLPIIILGFILSSCEKLILEKDGASSKPRDNFDYLWNECNEKYSFFDVKGIDWNQVKSKYSPAIYDGMSEDSLFNTLAAMINELKDDHTNLVSANNISTYGVSYASQDNFDWRIIDDNYLNNDFYITGPFMHNFLSNKQIGYVRYGAFTGTADGSLDFVLNRYKDTKGLILDLRENGGGATDDIYSILNRFVDSETTVYYTRVKNGPGHNDFSGAVSSSAKPYDGVRYTKPIMVLVDRSTYSAGSFFSLATKAIPHIKLIGDTTGGGLGLPNGGQLPNGWTYRFSITQTLTLDMNPNYENGVPADIPVSIDWTDRTKDEIIERAMSEILL